MHTTKSKPFFRVVLRGRGRIGNRTNWHWCITGADGKVYAADNCCGWRRNFDEAFELCRAMNAVHNPTRELFIKPPKWLNSRA